MAGLSRSEWLEFAKGELSAIPDVSEMADRALYLCMRMSSPLNTVHRADTKQKICSLCDDTLKLLASHNPSDSVLCNSVLVNIGLIKSENKKFRVASEDLTGPLTLIQHIVKQDYVSKSSRKVLHSYLTKSEKKLEKYFQVKFQLLQTLFSLQ
ncbi:hypothetical protein EB796_018584 [Bugula neritina]|uniref:Ran-GTPase activating protein 1 C-terminal domain-containing protein n=1 Tax=Bugula neritina TaxID=10212 RepID=A0A7J7JA56_BUGNE|nr:hypothetical protein EB796_018584 [Bugula neritina]